MPGGLPGRTGASILLKRATERFRRIFHQRGTHGGEKSQLRALPISVVNSSASLRRHFAEFEVMLRRHSEGVGHAIEEREHGNDVHRFGDLVFAPAMVA